jgi:sirohydrochlorin cobaltochelatase
MGSAIASFPALVLAGHGTRDAAGQAVSAELVADVQRRVPGIRVVAAYIDNQRPYVAEALRRLAADGVPRVAVVPLLLTAATHSKTDVAAAVATVRADTRQLAIAYGRPLGPDTALLTAVEDRLAEAGVGADDPDVAVVLTAAGAADPDANADIAKTARLLWEGRGWAAVEPAYASATRPTVTEVVGRLRRLGTQRIAVVPYFLSPGYLAGRVAAQATAAGADVVTDVLGAHRAVSALVVDRYREALAGDIRMNCDTCLYRTPIRGRVAEVGKPLVPRREVVG